MLNQGKVCEGVRGAYIRNVCDHNSIFKAQYKHGRVLWIIKCFGECVLKLFILKMHLHVYIARHEQGSMDKRQWQHKMVTSITVVELYKRRCLTSGNIKKAISQTMVEFLHTLNFHCCQINILLIFEAIHMCKYSMFT